MKVKAYAKINVSLDVVKKRDDGFHEMLMVMQRVGLWDDIDITVSEGKGSICVRSNRAYIPSDEKNIAGKAARVYLDEAGIMDKNIQITIKKHIPVCAGLGGGSSDAAAVLEGMDEIFDHAVSKERLFELAAELGSDVPFCLFGGTALASGRGEKLKKLPDFPEGWFVLCKPDFSVSTPELFNKLDDCKLILHPDTDGIVKALEKQDIGEISCRCYNVFEDVLPKRHRTIIDGIKDSFITNGAVGAAMSGTGSAVFGIFADESKAKAAYSALRAKYRDCFMAKADEAISN